MALSTTAGDNLFDPRRGESPVRLESLRFAARASEPARTNCFCIYWIREGTGTFWADASRHAFEADSLLFFVPYQHVRFQPTQAVRCERLTFHANFLCVETFHAEVGCSGALFNDPYGIPALVLDDSTRQDVASLVERIRREQAEQGLAHQEVLLACVKMLLIAATRLKSPPPDGSAAPAGDPRHPLLQSLTELIEANYRTLHAPADYAGLLHVTPKALGRVVRDHLGTTLTDLIRQRLLTHAKWQLLHTLKPVKEIAREVGFADELYFSRLFKKSTGVSPTYFREFETEIRGGSNLSMK